MVLTKHRDRIYSWLRRCLIGSGEDLIGIKPLDRYQTGILFPVVRGEFGLDPAANDVDAGSDAFEQEEDADEPGQAGRGTSPRRRRFAPPSSVGLSFFVAGNQVRFQLIPRGVRYVSGKTRDKKGRFVGENWNREVLGGDAEGWNLAAPEQRRVLTEREAVLADRAELLVLWRPLANGWLVTASLSNTQSLEPVRAGREDTQKRNENALFEVELECVVDAGNVGPYPGVAYENLSHEEQELELQYRHHRVYAVGHGAAVDWELREGRVHSIRTDFLPRVEVPQISAEVGGAGRQALLLSWLAEFESDAAERCDTLDGFVSGYGNWVAGVEGRLAGLEDKEHEAAGRIHKRMTVAVKRMADGVRLLRNDTLATRAFALANRAMLQQMSQTDRAAARTVREDYRWRPFQLAFLLLTLESTVNEYSDYRDILDLIWFPTGGGKTEAYLGLMAFLICWRRLKFAATGGGTTVLMRYTLRLLTKDQFRRAARLICALELLRRQYPELGTEPVTLGLWVGDASSPNTFKTAKRVLDEAIEAKARPPSLLVLDACPWCGAAFAVDQNYDAGAQHFHFRCESPYCDFGRQSPGELPCNVVDAALYQSPPTLLLATIDKFARLAWEERAGAFFGVNGNRPPELVIQDELHLIASALGSVAGLYEAGVETVLAMRGVTPKYVASTATIRMAEDQVTRLYGREAAVFPPPGLDCDDSYFARTVPLSEKPGRLYVGFLAPARDRAHCLAPLAGALLAAPEVLFDAGQVDRDALLDAWWTVLVYHGSLKGVGISRNALQDIETTMARYQAEALESRNAEDHGNEAGPLPSPPWSRLRQLAERLTQLTSQMSADENAATFDRLRHPRTHQQALDLVLATNMVSVGLDVSRLAVMVINGQPLTTAEYIQASSRVGRAGVPGLVVANYYRDQARSLSHYETFRAYHESFYRFVEPTSVTPYTYQARMRALHAALVIAIRHGAKALADNTAAGAFDPSDPATAKIIEELKLRCRRADRHRGNDTGRHLDDLARQWADAAQRAEEQNERLVYAGHDKDRRDQRLLYSHDSQVPGLWPTLHNMRNVENTTLVKIR
ncbi:MAG: helicase-related protein [Gammaproteobacteria bacterium]|nr:helicase-related protein [Gammaproteobacteria bacterium]